jgi:hypothetical protein
MWRFLQRLLRRGPSVGAKVWFAPKRTWGRVLRLERGGFVTFGHGSPIKPGREYRFSSRMEKDQLVWRGDLGAWVVGSGPVPKIVRGQVVSPEPVKFAMGATQ